MSEPTRYPLAWPAGRPRTKNREYGKFKTKTDNGRYLETKPVTVAQAMERLEAEIGRLGGIYPLLSSNIQLRLDGRPYSGQPEPQDPGVAVYFSLKGKPFALACDRYDKVAQNIAALAAHIEATRAISRHGVASAEETLQAFQALPPPMVTPPPEPPWWEVFGVVREMADKDTIEALYRAKARTAHPDKGGSEAAMARLNRARDAALNELKESA